jgi:putative nucleotidyltransferase with HDIG domain
MPSALFDQAVDPSATTFVRRSDVLAGLSYALDLTEGQRPGHSVRSALIGMRLADLLGLSARERGDLFLTVLMKDLGCSSNAARFAALFGHHDQDLKASLKTVDWAYAIESFRFIASHVAPGRAFPTRVWRFLAVVARGPEGGRAVVRTRCERGAEIAELLGLGAESAQAIRALDEHWDGGGQPYGRQGHDIPVLARIAGLAQTVEVFATTCGVTAAFDMAAARRGRWFDPAMVDAFQVLKRETALWEAMRAGREREALQRLEPADAVTRATDDDLDRIAEGFARVIDAKSPWTYRHSTGVADMAAAAGRRLGYAEADVRQLRRAALLHDVGKLGVSNLILDKPDKLTSAEVDAMRRHTIYTADILGRVACFQPIRRVAAAHHERLDGRGYHQGLVATDLPMAARILCVADIADALRASRPYREGLPIEQVLAILARDRHTAVDPACVDAMRDVLEARADEAASTTPARLVGALREDYVQAA